MASGADVLGMLIPQGGWIITGEAYEGIEFIDCNPITKEQFEAGFAKFDTWKAAANKKRSDDKIALLDRLGITADEAALLIQ